MFDQLVYVVPQPDFEFSTLEKRWLSWRVHSDFMICLNDMQKYVARSSMVVFIFLLVAQLCLNNSVVIDLVGCLLEFLVFLSLEFSQKT